MSNCQTKTSHSIARERKDFCTSAFSVNIRHHHSTIQSTSPHRSIENSTDLSLHRATLTKYFRATHLCQTSWCAVPFRHKKQQEKQLHNRINCLSLIGEHDTSASSRNSRVHVTTVAFKAAAKATAPFSPTLLYSRFSSVRERFAL